MLIDTNLSSVRTVFQLLTASLFGLERFLRWLARHLENLYGKRYTLMVQGFLAYGGIIFCALESLKKHSWVVIVVVLVLGLFYLVTACVFYFVLFERMRNWIALWKENFWAINYLLGMAGSLAVIKGFVLLTDVIEKHQGINKLSLGFFLCCFVHIATITKTFLADDFMGSLDSIMALTVFLFSGLKNTSWWWIPFYSAAFLLEAFRKAPFRFPVPPPDPPPEDPFEVSTSELGSNASHPTAAGEGSSRDDTPFEVFTSELGSNASHPTPAGEGSSRDDTPFEVSTSELGSNASHPTPAGEGSSRDDTPFEVSTSELGSNASHPTPAGEGSSRDDTPFEVSTSELGSNASHPTPAGEGSSRDDTPFEVSTSELGSNASHPTPAGEGSSRDDTPFEVSTSELGSNASHPTPAGEGSSRDDTPFEVSTSELGSNASHPTPAGEGSSRDDTPFEVSTSELGSNASHPTPAGEGSSRDDTPFEVSTSELGSNASHPTPAGEGSSRDDTPFEVSTSELNSRVRMPREELQLLPEPGSYVGEVVRVMGKNKALVKVHPKGKYVVDIDKSIDITKITPSTRVALRNDSYVLHLVLPSEVDPLVKLMKVEKVPDSTYDMIGGLDQQIKEIKEVIELPIKHPELCESLGNAQPKGLLLYGPPGTGKTLLARAVAHHTDCTFIRVSGSELVQKYIGEGSRMVRELFVMAREHAPSIVFMDEIDVIGSARTESGSGNGVSEVQRTMLELLNQLDGFEASNKIKVLMATNRIDLLDQALLRPGRIDRKIEFPNPNEDSRFDILKIHSREMNLLREIDLKKIAEKMNGASGAELKALCTEAGMFAIRDSREHVTQEDFEMAVAKVMKNIKLWK